MALKAKPATFDLMKKAKNKGQARPKNTNAAKPLKIYGDVNQVLKASFKPAVLLNAV